MSAPHIILDNLPSLCQKLSDLVEVWRSYNKNNIACFLRYGVFIQVRRSVTWTESHVGVVQTAKHVVKILSRSASAIILLNTVAKFRRGHHNVGVRLIQVGCNNSRFRPIRHWTSEWMHGDYIGLIIIITRISLINGTSYIVYTTWALSWPSVIFAGYFNHLKSLVEKLMHVACKPTL